MPSSVTAACIAWAKRSTVSLPRGIGPDPTPSSALPQACEAIWRFVERFMIISGVGEWRTLLTREGAPIDGNIGNPWKVAYHTGRAMLECTERLERLAGY